MEKEELVKLAEALEAAGFMIAAFDSKLDSYRVISLEIIRKEKKQD
jgi:hypothetical protein